MITNYFSVKGKRKENENFILSKLLEGNMSIHLITDGMGGYDYGRLAAETVANTIFEYLQTIKEFNNTNQQFMHNPFKGQLYRECYGWKNVNNY